jgi:transcriptional regulator with XRE-family HTH domain
MSKPIADPEAIGQRLRWAREQSGLSQGQVARLLDYHRPTISQIEAGERVVRPEELTRFAEIYGVSEAWIIKGDLAVEESDPRIEIAARELRKLKKGDLDEILKILKTMRSTAGGE